LPGTLYPVSFALSLAADVVEVEAGAKSPLSFTVVNQGTATDRFEVEIQGIDGEWVAIPVPAFNVEPGETLTEKAFLQPPRRPDGSAGAYPLVVRIRSLESGETKTAQALLKLLPYHHLTMEIAPKKGVISPTTKRNDFRLTVVNLGNSEHTLQLSAQDPDDRCAYEFENNQIVLGPGQQREVEMIANPKQTPFFSSGRLIGFSVVARSVTERNVSATTQAQLEQRSLLSPTTLATLVLLVAIFFGWWMMRPVPPSVSILSINPSHALPGEKIEIRISAEHADNLRVTVGPDEIYNGVPVSELSAEIKGDGGDTVSIVAEVSRDHRSETHDTKTVKIDQPVVVPEASIDDLKVSAKRVKLGSSFVLSWKVSHAAKVAIAPILDDLSPDLEQQQITPTATGVQTYTFIAFNSEGKAEKKTVSVEVYDESDATILSFTADPTSVKEEEGGKTTLAWQVTNAERVELTIGNAAPVSVNDTESREIVIGAKTSFILTAYDSKARKTVNKITVNFEKRDIVVDPPPTGVTTADPIPNSIPPPTR